MRIPIRVRSDVDVAARQARALGIGARLSAADADAVALAVRELGMNLVRYASGKGEILLSTIGQGAEPTGIEVESRDLGPGIPDLEAAMRDGYTTGGGLGSGLPAVRRLMDEFHIISSAEGTSVLARKWSVAQVAVGAATRPIAGQVANGDAWTIHRSADTCRIAVIDGSGHGPEAALAARRAVEALASDTELDPASALRSCHSALRSTRGAAIAVVHLDLAAGRLVYAGVGNVDAILYLEGRPFRQTSDRGILGALLPSIHPVSYDLKGDWVLIVHTDGVQGSHGFEQVSERSVQDPEELARAILARWGKATDDATVLVARSGPQPGVPNGGSLL